MVQPLGGQGRSRYSALITWMVVFGCGGCVKGQSTAEAGQHACSIHAVPRSTTVLVKIRSFRLAARARGHACSGALEALRYLAPALRELGHNLLVQPDIHVGGAVELAPVAKLLCQLFARTEAAV